MARRARIGYLNENNEYINQYAHWDNYPEHTGEILLKYFNSIEQIKNLIKTQIRLFEKNGQVIYYEDGIFPPIKIDFNNKNEIISEDYNYIFKNGEWFYWKNNNFNKLKKLKDNTNL